MEEADQPRFKSSLVSFDKLLDQYADATVGAAAQKDWPAASQYLQQLNNACISCHAMWTDKVR